MQFLSDEWCAALAAASGDDDDAAVDGETVTVALTVLGAPGGDVKVHADVALRDSGAAITAAGPGGAPGATIELTLPYEDSVAVLRGALAPSVAFMRGRLKTAGDPGRLLDVLAVTATPAFSAARDDVAARTEV